ncbi:MAG TPA: tetratricopeptide repeat protein [Thermoanaerobaculia bacterium]|jgi:tetratricopeptide (TPR) repeat protein|nr:tetratricopeptide repeat protein [Thermoanaerobaculia bacterium]
MTDSAFPDRLAQLRAKWDADSTSRVFLQLAEEYRHLGRVKEALEVLDRGLREHPGYLSALVAKGRCHLELSEGEPARLVLERVVKQDATQMVANKLLVRAYLETGEPDKARERLDLYSLLNDSDPEIEELRRRIKSLDRPAPAEEPRPMDADPFSLEPPAARREARPAAADVFDIDLAPPPSRPPHRGDDEIFALEAPAEAPEAAEPDDLPFPGLASPDHHRRYLEGLTAEGLFAFATPEPAPSLPPPLPIPAAVAAPEPAIPVTTDESSWLEEASVTTYALSPVEADEVPLFTAPAPAEPAEEDLWGEEPAELPAWSAAPEAPAAPAPAAEPIATATLGEIYLRQGYLAEAERIFQEVLQREPDNAAAHAGLAHLTRLTEKAPAPPLDARQLLAGFQPGPEENGVTARKVFLLKSYLTRLRGGSAHVS